MTMDQQKPVDFFENGLCMHCHLARQQLVEFERFNEISELAWENEDKQLQHQLDAQLRNIPETDHEEVVQSHGWELHVNQIKYPSIHRESLILTVFSFLEDELNSLCEVMAQSLEGSVELGDLKGKGIERALLYLRKIAGFDFTTMSNEISFLRGVNQVRNHIVHNGGRLPADPNHKVNQFVKSQMHVSGLPGKSLVIHKGFAPELMQLILALFDKLEAQVNTHISNYTGNA